MCKVIELLKR